MSKFIPYNSNPFDEPDIYRLIPESDDDAGRYALFIKNLIAALFYQDFEVELPNIYIDEKKDQRTFHMLHQMGNLKIVDFDSVLISPFCRFQKLELKALEQVNLPEAETYKDFLNRYDKIFVCIDSIVEYKLDNQEIADIGNFIHHNLGDVYFFDINDMTENFRTIERYIIYQLQVHLIESLHLDKFNYRIFEYFFERTNYHLSNELISSDDLNRLKELTYKWFCQFLRYLNFKLRLAMFDDVFENLKKKFIEAIDYEPPALEVTDIQYPKHIFSKPMAYLLFQEIASRMDKKSPISYLYRKMAEKDNLIRVRDTEFRDWFNNMDYPIQLHSTTETYERAFTPEREVFIDLLYEKYQLP